MIVTVSGRSGLTNAYRSVLSATGSLEISGASRCDDMHHLSGSAGRSGPVAVHDVIRSTGLAWMTRVAMNSRDRWPMGSSRPGRSRSGFARRLIHGGVARRSTTSGQTHLAGVRELEDGSCHGGDESSDLPHTRFTLSRRGGGGVGPAEPAHAGGHGGGGRP